MSDRISTPFSNTRNRNGSISSMDYGAISRGLTNSITMIMPEVEEEIVDRRGISLAVIAYEPVEDDKGHDGGMSNGSSTIRGNPDRARSQHSRPLPAAPGHPYTCYCRTCWPVRLHRFWKDIVKERLNDAGGRRERLEVIEADIPLAAAKDVLKKEGPCLDRVHSVKRMAEWLQCWPESAPLEEHSPEQRKAKLAGLATSITRLEVDFDRVEDILREHRVAIPRCTSSRWESIDAVAPPQEPKQQRALVIAGQRNGVPGNGTGRYRVASLRRVRAQHF